MTKETIINKKILENNDKNDKQQANTKNTKQITKTKNGKIQPPQATVADPGLARAAKRLQFSKKCFLFLSGKQCF